MLVISIRLRVHLFVPRHVEATARLRANAAVNEAIRLVRQGVALAKSDRARDAIARRFGAGLFTQETACVLFCSVAVGLHRLLRVRFTNGRCRVNGLNVRSRDLCVKCVRLNEGVRLLPSPTNVARRHRVNDSRDQGANFFHHIGSDTRRLRVIVVGGYVCHRVALRPVFVANPNCFTRVIGNGHVNQANARVRVYGAGVGEINASLGNYYG